LQRLLAAQFSVLILFGAIIGARAALQFDVFLGYDGVIPKRHGSRWCAKSKMTVHHLRVIELNGGSFNQGQVQKVEVELPTARSSDW